MVLKGGFGGYGSTLSFSVSCLSGIYCQYPHDFESQPPPLTSILQLSNTPVFGPLRFVWHHTFVVFHRMCIWHCFLYSFVSFHHCILFDNYVSVCVYPCCCVQLSWPLFSPLLPLTCHLLGYLSSELAHPTSLDVSFILVFYLGRLTLDPIVFWGLVVNWLVWGHLGQ